MFKRVFIIINPASGQDEPVLQYINRALRKSGITWEIGITQKADDAYKLAKRAMRKNFDLVAVYGGDGTVMEAALALYKRKTPLLVLPGGTANVMAKELGMSTNTNAAINLIKGKYKLKTIDMGMLDHRPFLLRLNLGVAAEMVKTTPRALKEKYGLLAYWVSALKHYLNHQTYTFEIEVDGKFTKETGVALMVTNVGNVGMGSFSLLPQIKIDDGFLDVIVLKRAAIKPVYTWFKSNITGKKPPREEIKHWKGKRVKIKYTARTGIIIDDIPSGIKQIDAKIVPNALTVVVQK